MEDTSAFLNRCREALDARLGAVQAGERSGRRKLTDYEEAVRQYGSLLRGVADDAWNANYTNALVPDGSGGFLFQRQFEAARHARLVQTLRDWPYEATTPIPALLVASQQADHAEQGRNFYAFNVVSRMIPDVLFALNDESPDGPGYAARVQQALLGFFADDRVRAEAASPFACLFLHPSQSGTPEHDDRSVLLPIVAAFAQRRHHPDPDDFETLLLRLDLARLGFFDATDASGGPAVNHVGTMQARLDGFDVAGMRGLRGSLRDVSLSEFVADSLLSSQELRRTCEEARATVVAWERGGAVHPTVSPPPTHQLDPALADGYSYKTVSRENECHRCFYYASLYAIANGVMRRMHAQSGSAPLAELYERTGTALMHHNVHVAETMLSTFMKLHAASPPHEFAAALRYGDRVLEATVDAVAASAREEVRRQADAAKDYAEYAFATGAAQRPPTTHLGFGGESEEANYDVGYADARRRDRESGGDEAEERLKDAVRATAAVASRRPGVAYATEFADAIVLHGRYEFVYERPTSSIDMAEWDRRMRKDMSALEQLVYRFVVAKLPAQQGGGSGGRIFDNKAFCKLEMDESEPDSPPRAIVGVRLHYDKDGGNTRFNRRRVVDALDALFPADAIDELTLLRPESAFAPSPDRLVWTPRRVNWWVDDDDDRKKAPCDQSPLLPGRLSTEQLAWFSDAIVANATAEPQPSKDSPPLFDQTNDVGLALLRELREVAGDYFALQADGGRTWDALLENERPDLLRNESYGLTLFDATSFPELGFDAGSAFRLEDIDTRAGQMRAFFDAYFNSWINDNRLADGTGSVAMLSLLRRETVSMVARRAFLGRVNAIVNELYRLGLLTQEETPRRSGKRGAFGVFGALKEIDANRRVPRRTQTCIDTAVACVDALKDARLDGGGRMVGTLRPPPRRVPATLEEMPPLAAIAATDPAAPAALPPRQSLLPVGVRSVFDALEAAGALIEGAVKFVGALAKTKDRIARAQRSNERGAKARLGNVIAASTDRVIEVVSDHVRLLEQNFATRLSRLVLASRTRADFVTCGFRGRGDFLAACEEAIDTLGEFKTRWYTGKTGVFLAIVAKFATSGDAALLKVEGGAGPFIDESKAWLKTMMARLDGVDLDEIKRRLPTNDPTNQRPNALSEYLDGTERGVARAAACMVKNSMVAMMSEFATERGVGAGLLVGPRRTNPRMAAFDLFGNDEVSALDESGAHRLVWVDGATESPPDQKGATRMVPNYENMLTPSSLEATEAAKRAALEAAAAKAAAEAAEAARAGGQEAEPMYRDETYYRPEQGEEDLENPDQDKEAQGDDVDDEEAFDENNEAETLVGTEN